MTLSSQGRELANKHLSASVGPAHRCCPPRPWAAGHGHGHSLHCCQKAALAQGLGQSPALALPGRALPMKLGLSPSLFPLPDHAQELRSLVTSLTSQRGRANSPVQASSPLEAIPADCREVIQPISWGSRGAIPRTFIFIFFLILISISWYLTMNFCFLLNEKKKKATQYSSNILKNSCDWVESCRPDEPS